MAAELPLDNPLLVAPVYWQQFVLHRGAAPSIADLYAEARTLLQTGLEAAAAAHGAIDRAGTLELWLDILPHLFTACSYPPHPAWPLGRLLGQTFMAHSSR